MEEKSNKAIPDNIKSNSPIQKSYFKVGEILDLRGGKFRVASFGKKFVMLEAIDGTKNEV